MHFYILLGGGVHSTTTQCVHEQSLTGIAYLLCLIRFQWITYVSQCQNSSKFLSVSYLTKTADVITNFFLHTILLIILNKAS